MEKAKEIIFQSTPPARGATIRASLLLSAIKISIHAPREGGDLYFSYASDFVCISIHAPREGGDLLLAPGQLRLGISIHAPREGGDLITAFVIPWIKRFQSTPPARGATRA